MGPVNMERIDARIKWGLVITGILTLGFLAAAALRENVFSNGAWSGRNTPRCCGEGHG